MLAQRSRHGDLEPLTSTSPSRVYADDTPSPGLSSPKKEAMAKSTSLPAGIAQGKKQPLSKHKLNKFEQLMARFHYDHVSTDPDHYFVPTDDPERLAEISFNPELLVVNHPIVWKSHRKAKLYHKIVAPEGRKEYKNMPHIDCVRLRSIYLPLELSAPKIGMEIEFIPFLYGFELDERARDDEMSWYVNFADQKLFGYCDTDHVSEVAELGSLLTFHHGQFASDEIMVMEHPILGSVRNALLDYATTGFFEKTFWESAIGYPAMHWKKEIDFDNELMYIPKDKARPSLRYKELTPLTVDPSGRPTPFIITNAPRLCKVRARGTIERDQETTKNTGVVEVQSARKEYDIYGNKFKLADEDVVEKAITPLPQNRHLTNFICMSAIDQLSNPQKPLLGEYKIHQVRHIFRTAMTAFQGAVNKARQNGYQRVAIHTGDWGCGEFGGNRTLMSFLQLAAARATGVDHIYYHSPDKKEGFQLAWDELERCWGSGENIETEKLLHHVLKIKVGEKTLHWKEIKDRSKDSQ